MRDGFIPTITIFKKSDTFINRCIYSVNIVFHNASPYEIKSSKLAIWKVVDKHILHPFELLGIFYFVLQTTSSNNFRRRMVYDRTCASIKKPLPLVQCKFSNTAFERAASMMTFYEGEMIGFLWTTSRDVPLSKRFVTGCM